MNQPVRLLLLGYLAVLILVDIVWESVGHFDVDFPAFAAVCALLPAPVALCFYYTYKRPDERIAAMLFGLSFLVIFYPCCSILSFFFLSAHGPRIDALLATFDRSIGINWPTLVAFFAKHQALNSVVWLVYRLSVGQAIATVIWLGWRADPASIWKVCVAIGICGLATILVWAPFPSIGAIVVYPLPPAIDTNLHAAVGNAYANDLLRLYAHGPRHITPAEIRGVVGFPSFHTEEAVVCTWYLRRERLIFIPVLIFNLLAIASCPIQGGHHVADLLGGIVLAAAAIAISRRIVDRLGRTHGTTFGEVSAPQMTT